VSILLYFPVPQGKHNILCVVEFDAPVEASNLVISEGMDQCDRLGNHNPNLQECTRCFWKLPSRYKTGRMGLVPTDCIKQMLTLSVCPLGLTLSCRNVIRTVDHGNLEIPHLARSIRTRLLPKRGKHSLRRASLLEHRGTAFQ
jgi:hypothetical protein